jgi:hypothetical protein
VCFSLIIGSPIFSPEGAPSSLNRQGGLPDARIYAIRHNKYIECIFNNMPTSTTKQIHRLDRLLLPDTSSDATPTLQHQKHAVANGCHKRLEWSCSAARNALGATKHNGCSAPTDHPRIFIIIYICVYIYLFIYLNKTRSKPSQIIGSSYYINPNLYLGAEALNYLRTYI